MSSGGTNLASGTRASIRYAREASRNVTPAGIGTPVDSVSADATGTGTSKFVRASGSWIDDGFVVGHSVKSTGFTTAENNGTWVVSAVSALELTVTDADDDIAAESAASGQTVQILMKKLRATGRNINLEKDVLESAEVDGDGQETDARHGFNRVVGSPGFQLSAVDFDDWIEFALNGSWVSVGVTGSPSLLVNSGPKVFQRTDGGDFRTEGFRPGDIIRTTGFTESANNADWRVTAVNQLTLVVDDPDSTMVTEGAASGKDIQLAGERLDLTAGLCTILVERAFADIAKYEVFNGVAVDSMQLTVSPEAIINGTMNLLGMSAVAMASTPLSSEDPVDDSGYSPYAAFDGAIYEGGEVVGFATSMEFTVNRNRSLNPTIGSKFSPDVFEGTSRITGTLGAFFEDEGQFNKFANETESSAWVLFQDPASAARFTNIVFPRIKYNGASMDPPQEGPIVHEMPFRALKATGLSAPSGATVNTSMSVQRSNS